MIIQKMIRAAFTLLVFASMPKARAEVKPETQTDEPKRVALLVGVNVYDKRNFGDLRWAENDVVEMADTLHAIGFDKVVTMTGTANGPLHADKDNIETQLDLLLRGVKKTDIVLVMLSGHGQQLRVEGDDDNDRVDNFYCPVDAVVNTPKTMISLTWLTDQKLNQEGGLNLLLVDACRDEPVVVDPDKGVRSRGVQGRVVSLPEGTAILFSCSAGQKSIERDGLKHGLFSISVIETLREVSAPGKPMTWARMVAEVEDRVAQLNPEQRPVAAGTVPRIVLGKSNVSFAASIGIKIVPIPQGDFLMGTPPEQVAQAVQVFPDLPKVELDDEGPAHRVRITKLKGLSAHEITVGQFRRFVESENFKTEAETDGLGGFGYVEGLYRQSPQFQWRNPGFVQADDQPVVNVSWNDAKAFCAWLSKKDGRNYRLPTEAEWEYACRAGTSTLYSNGDDPERLPLVANVADASAKAQFPQWTWTIAGDDGFAFTAPVGRFAANAWGLFDMQGNVWEWCDDGYDPMQYVSSVESDPRGPDSAGMRSARGGCWNDYPRNCRAAYRYRSGPTSRFSSMGFRVAEGP